MMRASAVLLLVLALPAGAQRRPTPHTLAPEPGAPPPRAALSDAAWLAGHWQGPGLGGTSEEVWTAPFGGSMMGSYKLVRGDSVVFYEILALVETDSTLVLNLKHFGPDLIGWEEREEVRSFPLVRLTESELFFEGMTIRRLDTDNLQIHLAIEMRDGTVREEEFRYRRVRPALSAVSAASSPSRAAPGGG